MMLTVDCPDDTVIGPDGTCVCDKGYEPSSELGVCQPCPSGRKKDSVSNDQCEVDSLPLVVGLTVGLVMTAIFCVIALVWRWHVSKVRMRMAKLAFEKQNRIERDFMAVTCHEVRNPLNGTAAYLQFAVGLLESASGRWGSESAGLEPIRRLSPEKTMPRRALAVETDSEAEKDCNDVAASKQGSTSRTSAGEDGDDSSEGLSGMVKGALVCTNVALRVLENLTTLERLRQGLLTMNETPSQLQDVLAEVTAVLKPQIRATGAVDLRVRADPLTDKWQFWCDKKILAQVLINIGQNAVRFTVSGFIEIAAEVSETDETNKRGSGELHSWRPRQGRAHATLQALNPAADKRVHSLRPTCSHSYDRGSTYRHRLSRLTCYGAHFSAFRKRMCAHAHACDGFVLLPRVSSDGPALTTLPFVLRSTPVAVQMMMQIVQSQAAPAVTFNNRLYLTPISVLENNVKCDFVFSGCCL